MEIINIPGLFAAMLGLVVVAALCGAATKREPVKLWDDEPGATEKRPR